ncbi:hypothetical protein EDB19DRAFT_1757857 [Suillus lakei]|nr:hypothetical protein EDB19DRAFT_1757857 [Suillus lakei]
MVGQSDMMCASAALHHYPWDDIPSVVDVGSGIGTFFTHLAKVFPHTRITNQDLPEVVIQGHVSLDIQYS